MKAKHKQILEAIAQVLETTSSQRFRQALFNLNINLYEDAARPGSRQLRVIYGDKNEAILKRITGFDKTKLLQPWT